ncbi:MAG: WbuC family cupin fold metalloprotein [Elainellaceae cyanobacterium]
MKTQTLKLLTQEVLDTQAKAAAIAPRLRKNYNLHHESERVQRFVNVLQPGTYVRPHCHYRDDTVNGFELFVVLQGEVAVVLFDEHGHLTTAFRICDGGEVHGVELPEGTFHTLVALAPNTVILEIKEGPYNPQQDKVFMSQFPQEGTPEAAAQVTQWEQQIRENYAESDSSV